MFRGSEELLETNPNVDEVMMWDFLGQGFLRSLRYIVRLRRRGFDLSITAYPSNRVEYSTIASLIGAKVRAGHRYAHRDLRSGNFLYPRTIPEREERHNVEENLALLRSLGIEAQEPVQLDIYLSQEDERFADAWLEDRELTERKRIGIHAGTARFKNHVCRRWPKERFAALADLLHERHGAAPLIFGGPDETELKTTIAGLMSTEAYPVHGTTIRQTAALINRCDLFISNDSALMHTAAALSIRCVAVFGPTNPTWVHPYGTRYEIVRKGLDCSPCFYYSTKPLSCYTRRDFACVREIEATEVLEAAERLLPGGEA